MTRLTLALLALSTAPAFALCGGTCETDTKTEVTTEVTVNSVTRGDIGEDRRCHTGIRRIENPPQCNAKNRKAKKRKAKRSTLVEEDTYVGGKF